MAQKAIREYDAKSILARHWDKYFPDFTYAYETVMVQNGSELNKQAKSKKWLNEKTLVAKPDMLFGKRGKNDLVLFKDSKPGDVKLAKALLGLMINLQVINQYIFHLMVIHLLVSQV